ncbi:hypothetical protein M422DRAFT_243713 [Sphaerobolus stellatus SS14]|nr:hypothetical protein M422DRAFT_243713 [Sphaerobolus stellatus SS14]
MLFLAQSALPKSFNRSDGTRPTTTYGHQRARSTSFLCTDGRVFDRADAPSLRPRTEMNNLVGSILITRLSMYITAPLRANVKERPTDARCHSDARSTEIDLWEASITNGDVYTSTVRDTGHGV